MVVVRHGRTAWNASGRFQGHTDIPLDEEGRRQAADVARMLEPDSFDRAVTSDLMRACETAEIVLGRREVELEVDPRWREMRFGSWEGLAWREIVERQPELATRSASSPRFYTPAGGESFDDLCVRIADALDAIRATVADRQRVLVATHAGPLHGLLRVALGEDEAGALAVRFSPASTTRIAFDANGARVVELNRTAPAIASR